MLAPQGVVELTLSERLPPFAAGSLAWLDLAIVQPQETLWSQADHKVARQQFTLPTPLALPAPVAAATLSEQPDSWLVTTANSQWWLDKQSGPHHQLAKIGAGAVAGAESWITSTGRRSTTTLAPAKRITPTLTPGLPAGRRVVSVSGCTAVWGSRSLEGISGSAMATSITMSCCW